MPYDEKIMMKNMVKIALLVLTLLTGCRFAGADCPHFAAGQKIGIMEPKIINEASGIAASKNNPGVLWVHNDSGDLPRFFALSQQGKLLGIYNLVGAKNRDWEDIALGPGPEPNIDYLYLGDIGDNDSKRKSVTVYRVVEPNVDTEAQKPIAVNLTDFTVMEMTYPQGPRDAETLMVDPLTKDIYIISKEGRGKVFLAPYPQSSSSKTTLQQVAILPWGMATGGDISRDGRLIIVRNYITASIWRRPKDGPLWKAFESDECPVPLIFEKQGEAICFDPNGSGYYTTSEHKHQPIYYFPREQKK